MHRITVCPCCDAPIKRTIPVVVAPFVRERALQNDAQVGHLSDCADCGFRCYVDRYTGEEISALYAGYRDESYLKQRHRHEPWYTRAVNEAIGGQAEIARRTQRLGEFFVDRGILPTAQTVLDWGGDRGQFIPDRFVARYVYDISGVEPIPGVTAVSSEQLSQQSYDVILLAHVLEHASDPIGLLREVLTTKTKHLYVEVPFEPFRLRPTHNGKPYARWVASIAKSKLYPIVAFASIASRLSFGHLPPFGILQQHEHLNFFTEATLIRMLERVGCRVTAAVAYRKRGKLGPIESIGVLASPSQT